MKVTQLEHHEKFSELFINYNSKWANVWQFMILSEKGFDGAYDEYKDEVIEFFQEMRPGGSYTQILKNPDQFFRDQDKHAANFTMTAILNAKTIANTTALVFGHSLLDWLLYEYLELTSQIDASLFWPFIKEQKVSVVDILEQPTREDILAKQLGKKLSKMERLGLVEKADFLHKSVFHGSRV